MVRHQVRHHQAKDLSTWHVLTSPAHARRRLLLVLYLAAPTTTLAGAPLPGMVSGETYLTIKQLLVS